MTATTTGSWCGRSATPIVHAQSGAHLYGTATPSSDLDQKSVFLPAARDILLQRVQAAVVDHQGRRSGADHDPRGVDAEAFSLQHFLALLAEGQPVAIEVLFTPDRFMLSPPHRLWREVQALGPALISRRAGIFARYCRRQADLYGAKGGRAAAARLALHALAAGEAAHSAQARLSALAAELAALAAASPHIRVADVVVRDDCIVRHLDVCGHRTPFTATIATARKAAERLVASYGDRAQAAARTGGVDWKALSHAVRIGREALELFTTGRLQFPLACAPHLLAIKRGHVRQAAVAEEIEALLPAVEQAAAASSLPEQPDRDAAEALVLRAYRERVPADGC